MDEVEDSLKNLHTLQDEVRFLKMQLIKVSILYIFFKQIFIYSFFNLQA